MLRTCRKLAWFAVSGVFLGFIHHITAVILAIPTVSATNHLVSGLDEFLLLQIDPPRLESGDKLSISILPDEGTNHHVIWRLSIEIKFSNHFVLITIRIAGGGYGVCSNPYYRTPNRCLLFSITYALPNLQLFCFDNVATVGW